MKQAGIFNFYVMKNFSDGVSRAVESGKKIAAAGTLALAAATTTQSAVANTISITDPTLMASNSQNVARETWEAKLSAPIYLPGVTLDFGGPTSFSILGSDGIEKLVGVQYTGIKDYNTPIIDWIQLNGFVFDENIGDFVDKDYVGSIDFLGAESNQFNQTIFHTSGGDLYYDDGPGIFNQVNSNFSFEISAPVSSVPTPAAGWLFASGLPLVAAAARRRRSKES